MTPSRTRTTELYSRARRFGKRLDEVRSYLYAVAGGELVKLGRSSDPDRRFGTLQRSSPVSLSLLAVVPEFAVSEEAAHERWAELREHGEWFRRTPALDAWIRSIARRGVQLRSARERVAAVLSPPRVRRPLAYLGARIREVEDRIAERAEVAERARGCRLCGEHSDILCRSKYAAGLFCQSCTSWLASVARFGLQEIGRSAREKADDAAARLALHRKRAAAVESGSVRLTASPRPARAGGGA